MQFVYPGFLFGLLALSIPVVIHLFNFRRFKTVYFSNVRFLRQVQEETATKNKLKHFLVLLARLLALAALVFAFAQPFIPSGKEEEMAGKKAVSIYIDNSFSMEAEIDDERLIDIAKRKAEEIVEGYTVDDQFQLLTNDLEAKHQRLLSKEDMIRMIAEVQIGPVVRPINEIVARQRDVLNRAETDAVKISFLLSDFQRNAGTFENDSTILFNLVPLTQKSARNVSVDSVWFTEPVQMLNQPINMCVRLRNYGDEDVQNMPVTLRLNDQIKAIADISVPALGDAVDTLSYTINTGGWYSGEVSLKDYPVTFDDLLYFSFRPVERIPVMCINGGNENDFIKSLFGNNTLFELTNNSAAQIAFSELGKYDLIILNEVNAISGGLADALRQQLDRGANVMLVPGLSMDVNSVNAFLQSTQSGVYGTIQRKQRAVTEVNTQNPLFNDVFEKVPKNLAMPSATASYNLMTSVQTREEMILRFADRQAMLARYPHSEGFVYVSAVPFDRAVTDLPVQAGLFAPLMYKVAISNARKFPSYASIGTAGWINLPGVQLPGDETVRVQSAGNEFIPEIRRTGNRVDVNLGNFARQSGLYTILPGKDGLKSDQLLALNYNRKESDLQFSDADMLSKEYSGENIEVVDNVERNFTGLVTQQAGGTPLWKFCVIFALVFLAAEILLIRFMP